MSVTYHMSIETGRDLALYAIERTSADEENIFCIDSYHLLLRMLTAAIWRHEHGASFQQLEQTLLHAFTADIAGNGRIIALTGDFIDFIYEYNTAFGLLDIVVARL